MILEQCLARQAIAIRIANPIKGTDHYLLEVKVWAGRK